MKPLTEKYKPKTAGEVQGQDKAVSQLKNFVANYNKGKKKAALLHGPPGTGKTCAVYAVAGDLNLEVVEINASDTRNKGKINEILGGAVHQRSLFSKGKVILVDEVDGLSGTKDRGGLQEVMRLAEASTFPVVMTANDAYDSKFSALRRKSNMIEFGNLNYLSVAAKLREVADKEGIEYDDDSIKSLARKAQGDLRAGINDLQALCEGTRRLSKDDVEVMDDRARKESIFQSLVRVFKTTNADVARGAYDDVDADLDELFLWIENNIEKEYRKPRDLADGFDNLSWADIFYGRIRKWQHYRFYVYCYDLLSAGIALAKAEKYSGFNKFSRSQKPLKIWRANQKLAKKRSVAEKVAGKTHTSVNQAMQSTLPYLKVAFAGDKDFARDASEFFELDDGEISWLNK